MKIIRFALVNLLILMILNPLICQERIDGKYQFIEYPNNESPIHNLEFRKNGKFIYKMNFCYPHDYGIGTYSIQGDSMKLVFKNLKKSNFQITLDNIEKRDSFIFEIKISNEKSLGEIVRNIRSINKKGSSTLIWVDNMNRIYLPRNTSKIEFDAVFGFDSIEFSLDKIQFGEYQLSLKFEEIPFGFNLISNEDWKMEIIKQKEKIIRIGHFDKIK